MKKILSVGIVKALLFQIIGTTLGVVIVIAVRLLLGLELEPWEPAVALGGFLGVIGFMIGVGVLGDWFKWAKGEKTADHHDLGDTPTWKRYLGVDYDHKVIGVQYGVTSLALLTMAGIMALIFRTQLVWPGGTDEPLIVADTFNTLISLHGMVMIASILLGVGAMMNFLVPLMIGASDMAFPRLNSFAFWINVPGALLVVSSIFLGGVDAGWTSYPPLSSNLDKMGYQVFLMGVYFVGLSSVLGSINVIVTVIRMRAPGMSFFKMPIFVWAALATSIIQLTATQLIGLSFQMVMFQRLFGMGFFDPIKGGNVLLFQHLFWFYSHPAVYVFVLPGLGIISELLPVFSRKPLFGYKWIAMSSMGIALVGFFVWAHHMFASGMEEYLRVPFMYSTLLVAIPTGVKFFSWVATMWEGKLSFPTPMLFTIGAILVFLFGGLTGPPNATVATDLFLHDTYFIVGHFHNTMFGGYVFPLFAAIYFWFPKITGRRLNEKLGKLHFWLMTPSFLAMMSGQMLSGLRGMRRRIYGYDPALGIDGLQMMVTISGFLIAISITIFMFNLIRSLRTGEIAEGNIWNSRSPMWQLPNPAPLHNYQDHPFEVVGEPYDYGEGRPDYVKMGSTSSPNSTD